jgi:short-subunit dehydrogenase
MIQLNVTAVTELSYVFGRDMAARGSGQILLIASLLGLQPVPNYAAYAATKSYVHAFGEALHDELRPQGVVVTSLCPGHTETRFDAAAGAPVSPMLRLLTMKPRPVAETIGGALERCFQKFTVQPVSGIVHQNVDLYRFFVEAAFQAGSGSRRGKIDWLDKDIDAMLPAKVSGERFHWFPSPGREHEIDLPRRQQLSKFDPKAA